LHVFALLCIALLCFALHCFALHFWVSHQMYHTHGRALFLLCMAAPHSHRRMSNTLIMSRTHSLRFGEVDFPTPPWALCIARRQVL
jgi:hypothetical protein